MEGTACLYFSSPITPYVLPIRGTCHVKQTQIHLRFPGNNNITFNLPKEPEKTDVDIVFRVMGGIEFRVRYSGPLDCFLGEARTTGDGRRLLQFVWCNDTCRAQDLIRDPK